MIDSRRSSALGAVLFAGLNCLAAPGRAAPLPEASEAPPADASLNPTPPRPLELVEPEFPEQARGGPSSAVVVLRLTIDSEGNVREAEIVEKTAEGFEEAARAALLRSRFTPAVRDGRAVAAKILYRVEFTRPPEAAPSLDAESARKPGPAAAVVPEKPAVSTLAAAGTAPAHEQGSDVTVAGARSEASTLQRSAAAVTVVDLTRAKRRSSDLGEVMARTFGVSVRRSGGLGSDTRFSLNGLQEDQLRMFLNGIPLEHAFPFGIANVPVNLLERVEIYRGVVPVRYASDALGGAVNLITDRSYDTRIAGAYELGSFGTRRAHLLGRYRHDESGFVLGLETFADGANNDFEVDVEVPDERGRLAPATIRRFHDRYRAYGIAVDAGFVDVPWARRLVVRALRSAYDKQLQNNLVMSVPYGEVWYGAALNALQLQYEHTLLPGLELEVRGSYGDTTTRFSDQSSWVYDWHGNRVRERRVRGEIDGKPTDAIYWDDAVFGRVSLGYRFDSAHRVLFATASDYTTRTGDERIQPVSATRDPLSAKQDLFKQVTGVEYEFGAFRRNGRQMLDSSGGSIDHALQNVFFVKNYLYRVDAEEPLPGNVFRSREQNRLRFGIGNGLRWLLTDYLYVKGSYELATRMPRADEVFGDGMLVHASLELQPEVSDNGNLGARLELERTRFGDLMLDVNTFVRDTRDQIVLLGNDRFFSYQNIYRAISVGAEGAFEWIAPGRVFACDGSLTWNEQRNRSVAGGFVDYAGDRIPNRPWLGAAFGARLRFQRLFDRRDELEPFYTARYVHQYFRGWESVGRRDTKQIVPAQLIHGAGVTYTLRRGAAAAWTTLELQNFTNARAYDFYGQERPGRAVFMKVTATSR